ncbi:3-keto-5-aminohexanoate cleavage protein [Pseudemcibacter aquimaris]|uniref:3-keto-5-aminohexanoate cleavage protein n=1 Tax=Pseudemcibacter aquimaris TaxID=2857064 RepID=UPI00201302D0|nr:3-keto-5-aminohexanoate cleavage protein [Pseudemcibacter aquimaris]MCC3860412.1 3-keto-5-aminohexanoate cleavage protein [Pseudemcibacter aquimaris]WDU57738.1 3-keto-5-aminohexanoate cleavage protein [Pseudemcibacter aquimaris]
MNDHPFIIMCAPNGARRVKKDHPEIPITPSEMADCAELILENGASILHLHVRDDNGGHSLDPDRYRASIKTVRERVGKNMIIQATTEAVGIYNREQQMEIVHDLKPEAVSLALRELCPTDQEMSEFAAFNEWLIKEHIFPQYILYNEADYKRFMSYQKQGVFHQDNPFILFVMGSYAGPTPETAKTFECATSHNGPWASCGFADNEKECIEHSINNGGHIRIGFENNIWREDGTLLENNGEMIKYAADRSTRSIASADDVRNIFNLRD